MDNSGSSRFRVLFVCALNQWRSPTAERIYRNDARLEVRSAGVRSEARRRVSRADLEWADVVFVVEREQKRWIQEQFRDVELPEIRVVEIADEFHYMDPRLREALRTALDPEIENLLARRGQEM